jgi:hypothetical protein
MYAGDRHGSTDPRGLKKPLGFLCVKTAPLAPTGRKGVMTDENRADKIKDLLDEAEVLLSDMDGDTDPIIGHILEAVVSCRSDLEDVAFDEEGNIEAPPEDREVYEDWEELDEEEDEDE